MSYLTALQSAPALETIYRHRSIRKYEKTPVEAPVLEAILEAGRAASSSSFMQCVHIIRVTDSTLREALCEVAAGQRYVVEAPEFLVFCVDYHKHHQLVPDAQTDWTETLIIGATDAGIMAQNCLLAAESLGLGGVYIGSLRNDIARVAELLALPRHTLPLFGLCLGYTAEEPLYRPRLPLAISMSENRYTPADSATLAAYNDSVRDYYQQRGDKVLDWQQAVNNTLGKPVRPHMLPFLQAQGFCKR
ncbi:MAG: oxygen-insensitive NADPH nitroreductase [Cardiobacteriaceae bacterium]|nr:oxygen-insensitive NADPH nitroreductase [Cardiobacteriaceae bacterium]